MKCAKCQFENPAGLTFCGKCGARLETICYKCNFSNPSDFAFCGKCGNNLILPVAPIPKEISFDEKLARIQRYLPKDLAQKILAQKGKIEGERKQVTVMFCDMAGFTSLTEKLGSEQMYSIMDKVYEILIHQVHDYEGTVNELTGDGIMALFGAPIALEDGPQRAIRSALAIHQEINKFSNQHNREKEISPIEMRIGINTGQVIVGTLGNDLRVEFKAVGDTVNLASRMEGLAEPGTTYVTEETYRLARDLFYFQPLGIKKVKGKEEPIPVYKVLSALEAVYRPRVGSERQIYSEMVGRDNELNRLELQVMKAVNGQGSVVNIIGEAGIGKSRLVAELKKREFVQKVALLEGRAISMGRNLSYYPIIDCLKQWAQLRADDRNAAALAKLEAAVVSLFPEDVGEVVPFIATLMGMDLWGRYAERVKGIEGEALEKMILKNVRELFIRATQRIPLVIVTEDLQWADMSSIELLESLFGLAESHGVLFINVFRPGHKETGDRIAVNVKQKLPGCYVEIVLKPLNERLSETLISNMLNVGLHHTVIQDIIQRAGGNPFFIEEVVRSLIDEGAIVLREGRFEVTEKVSEIPIPNTVNDVLMARIDRLEEKTRNLVKVASVIGRSFYHKILSDVASEVEDIDGRLSYLMDIQLLRERRRMGEVEYLFNHALAQEAAYESLLPPRRRDLHLKVAQSIEKIFNEKLHEFYGMLAYHYSRAEDHQKTEEYLIKAGEEALRSAASDDALYFYEEALELYLKKSGPNSDPEKIAMLEKNIALALYNRGQQKAVEYFDKALDYYWGKLPKGRISVGIKLLAAFLHFLIALYLPSFKFRKTPTERDIEIFDLFTKKIRSVSLTDAKRFFVEYFYLFRFISSFDLRKFKEGPGFSAAVSALFSYSGISFALSRKVLDGFRNSISENDVVNYTMYKISETVYLFLRGNWKELKDYDDGLVDRNCMIGQLHDASQYLYWNGLGNIGKGSFDKARAIVNRLHDLFVVYGNGLSEVFKYQVNTMLLIESGKLDDALIESQKGIAFEEKARSGSGLWQLPILQASIHKMMGAIQQAQECLERADRRRLQTKTAPYQLSSLFKTQSDFDLYRLKEATKSGNRAEIDKFRRKTFKSVKSLQKVARKVAYHRTDFYRLSGAYCWTMKKHKKALSQWRQAIQEGERLGARPQLARLYSEVGRCLLESKGKYTVLDGLAGEEYLDKAGALFEEMKMESSP
jgi:class 3 adenylate cyclase